VKCSLAFSFPFSGVIIALMRRFLSSKIITGSCSAQSFCFRPPERCPSRRRR
jgi:hypothetical protein